MARSCLNNIRPSLSRISTVSLYREQRTSGILESELSTRNDEVIQLRQRAETS